MDIALGGLKINKVVATIRNCAICTIVCEDVEMTRVEVDLPWRMGHVCFGGVGAYKRRAKERVVCHEEHRKVAEDGAAKETKNRHISNRTEACSPSQVSKSRAEGSWRDLNEANAVGHEINAPEWNLEKLEPEPEIGPKNEAI